jgi:holo-[acyl-carrier protein] synthase
MPGRTQRAEQQALAHALRYMARDLLHEPLGIGIDVVDVTDFDTKSLEECPGFHNRCFSDREITYCAAQAHPAQHFAVRFAAKEAAVKALADRMKLAYWQIEVVRQPDGRPTLQVWTFDRAAPLAAMHGLDLKVSLSHTEHWAVAVVVAFARDDAHA